MPKRNQIEEYKNTLVYEFENSKLDKARKIKTIKDDEIDNFVATINASSDKKYDAVIQFCGQGKIKRANDVRHLSYAELVEIMKEKNMPFKKIPVESNDFFSAVFNIIQFDDEGIVLNALAGMDPAKRMFDIRFVCNACAKVLEGIDDIPEEIQQCLDFLKQVDTKIVDYTEDWVYASYANWRLSEVQEKRAIEESLREAQKIEEANQKKREELLKKEEGEKKELFAKVKNYKKGDPVSIKLFATDFVDLVNAIKKTGHLADRVDEKRVLDHLNSLDSDEKRNEYFMELLKMDQHPRGWEYSDEFRKLPQEIRNSGNIDELKEYYYKNQETLPIQCKAVIVRRIHSIELAKKISANSPLVNNMNVTKDKKDNLKVKKYLPKTQTSKNGCWSVAMQIMLHNEGIDVDQEDIRGYLPDYDAEARKDEKVDGSVKYDQGNDIAEMGDKILAFAPNRMLRTIEVELPSRTDDYHGPEIKIDIDDYSAAATRAIAKKIRQVLNVERAPLSFTNGSHYYTIIDIDDYGTIKCLDSGSKEIKEFGLQTIIKNTLTGRSAYDKQPREFRLQWLSKIELGDDNSIINAPSHYLGVNDDGSYKLPPKLLLDEFNTYKTKMEKNGFRVKMVGGVDDSAYDRLKRNPLSKDGNVLINEYAYMPNKVDIEVLKKRRAQRNSKYTENLLKSRDELLGKNFVAPDYSKLTENEINRAYDEHHRARINHNIVYEFMEASKLLRIPENEKHDAEGNEYLYNKPGAVVAYRVQKTYEGLRQLYSHMVEVSDNHPEWVKHLSDLEKRYKDFMKIINAPENAIKKEIKTGAYKLSGYPKSEKDIAECLKLLYGMSDSIPLLAKPDKQTFGMKWTFRVFSINHKEGEKYDPTVISMFAEAIKEFSSEKLNGNPLKDASKSKVYRRSIELLTSMPTKDPKILDKKFTESSPQVQNYLYFCRDATIAVYSGNAKAVEQIFDKFDNDSKLKKAFAEENIKDASKNQPGAKVDEKEAARRQKELEDINKIKTFPGKGVVIEYYPTVWGYEPAVIAYQLKWIDKINKALFPNEYEFNPAMKAISDFLSEDNIVKLGANYVGYNNKSHSMKTGPNGSVNVDSEVKQEKMDEAKLLLNDLTRFFEEKSKEVGDMGSIAANLSKISSVKNQMNLLLMSSEGEYGEHFLEKLTKEPYLGTDINDTNELIDNADVKQAIYAIKKHSLEKIVSEMSLRAAEKTGDYLNDSEQIQQQVRANTEYLRGINKLNTAAKKSQGNKDIADRYLATENGALSDKEINLMLDSENKVLSNGMENEFAQVVASIRIMAKEIESLPLDSFSRGHFDNEGGEVRLISNRNRVNDNYKKTCDLLNNTLKNPTPENKIKLIEHANVFVNDCPKGVKSKLHWYQYRDKYVDFAKKLRFERQDYKEAVEIVNIEGPLRAKRLIKICEDESKYGRNVLSEFWDILNDMDGALAKDIYDDIIKEKGAVLDELLGEITKVRPELGVSFETAIREGRFGELGDQNKDEIVRKMAARLAMAARPDLVKELETLDSLIKLAPEKAYNHSASFKQHDNLKTKYEDPQNGIIFTTFDKRDQVDPELQDIRLVIDTSEPNDRIAIILSDEERNRIYYADRSKYNKYTSAFNKITDLSISGATLLNKFKLEDSRLNERRLQNENYNQLIQNLVALKNLNPDSTGDNLKNAIINSLSAANNYKEELDAKGDNLTEEERCLKDLANKVSTEMGEKINDMTELLPLFGNKDKANTTFAELAKPLFEKLNKDRYGTDNAVRDMQQVDFMLDALEIAKTKARKCLKDMNANKSGNSWQFEEMKNALVELTELDENTTLNQIVNVVKNIEASADLYVKKTERQIHPFGEPMRTTIARGLCQFAIGLSWPEREKPGRGNIENYLNYYPAWGSATVSLIEQKRALKTQNLESMTERSNSTSDWKRDFLSADVIAAGLLADKLNPNHANPPQYDENYRFGGNKVNDKLILASKLREVASIDGNTTMKDVIRKLDSLKTVAEHVQRTNKRKLADRQDGRPIKAEDITAQVNGLVTNIKNLDLSRDEKGLTINNLAEERASIAKKVAVNKKDSFKRGDEIKKNPSLRR